MAKLSGILLALGLLAPATAQAQRGWDCTFEGLGNDPARSIVHLDLKGHALVEPRWPASIAYRILVDTRDMLIAARAYEIAPTFRSDARGAAAVIILNKRDGHLRRATTLMGEPDDRVETGTCERR